MDLENYRRFRLPLPVEILRVAASVFGSVDLWIDWWQNHGLSRDRAASSLQCQSLQSRNRVPVPEFTGRPIEEHTHSVARHWCKLAISAFQNLCGMSRTRRNMLKDIGPSMPMRNKQCCLANCSCLSGKYCFRGHREKNLKQHHGGMAANKNSNANELLVSFLISLAT